MQTAPDSGIGAIIAGFLSAAALVAVAWVTGRWQWRAVDRQKRAELEVTEATTREREREKERDRIDERDGFAWQINRETITDLKQEVRDLKLEVREKDDTIDRIRAERDLCMELCPECREAVMQLRAGRMVNTGRVSRRLIEAAKARPLEGVRALVLDDSERVAKTFGVALGEAGAEVVVLVDGDEAEAVYCDEASRFGALLLDLQMPKRDGMTILRTFRQFDQHVGRPTPPAIAISGYAAEDYEAKARKAGFALYLEKPVEVAVLIEGVRKVTGRSA